MGLKLDEIFEGKTEREVIIYLHNLYVKGASTATLGFALGVTDVTIRKYFKKYNLPIQSHGGHYKGKNIHISLEEYMSTPAKELMKKYNCSQFTYYQLTKTYPSRVGRNKKNVGGKK